MCFSAEASFTAALVLGSAGGISLRNCSSRSQFFLAAIPLLFAFQQLSEGLVWLHFSHGIGSPSLFQNAEKSFLIFAFLIWPIWIPLSLLVLEKVSWRRTLLYLNLACGIVLSLLNLKYGLQQEPAVQVVNHSLQYSGQVAEQTYAYPLIVLLPCFLSSLKNVWAFGLLITIGYVIADYFYEETFVSMWCFFAAVVSLSVYKILKDSQMMQENENPLT